MDNYPVIAYAGAALLGEGSRPDDCENVFTVQLLAPSNALKYSVEAVAAIGVDLAGICLKTRRVRRHNLSGD
jgi:hypothetical protein